MGWQGDAGGRWEIAVEIISVRVRIVQQECALAASGLKFQSLLGT